MLVLASASPRRQELLRNAGIPFIVHATEIPEIPNPGETPKAFAERMAKEKAVAVVRQRSGDLILGADTVVMVDQQILGKPVDLSDAGRMLRLLSGRTHTVITGVCLLRTGNREPATDFCNVRSDTTLVRMEQLTDGEIASYTATTEPMDKAGAYAIQGRASRWISRIEGDYFNVVGLPVALVFKMLLEHRIRIDERA